MIEYKEFHPYPFLYHFRDPLGTCFSIIKGSKKAIVVDTGYGMGNIRKLVESKINTPYIVINTHGHMDHTCGNYQFDKIYCPEKDLKLCQDNNSCERRKLNIEDALKAKIIDNTFDTDTYIKQGEGNTVKLTMNHINLGDLNIDIIPMPGHTSGSIGLLIKEKKILLTGDAAILNIWLFLDESTDRLTYQNMLKETYKLDFNEFLTGHLMKLYPKRYFKYFLEVSLLATKENSIPVSFNHFEKSNTYMFTKKYEGDTIGICFNANENKKTL